MTIKQQNRKLNPAQHTRRVALLTGVVAILLLFITACHHRPTTLQYQPISERGWRTSDTLRFTIDSLTQAGNYNLHAMVRTSAAHPYDFRQLVVEIRQHWYPADYVEVDTVEFQMSALDGEVEGQGVTIFSYEVPTVTLQQPQGAHAQIEVRHLMRRSPLGGISDVGICLKKEE